MRDRALLLKRFRLAVWLVLIMPARLWPEYLIKSTFQCERPKVCKLTKCRSEGPAATVSSVSHGATTEYSDGAPSTVAPTLALLVAMVLFGANPPIMKLVTAPPMLSAAVRFMMSAVVVWVALLVSGQRLPLAILRRAVLPGCAMALNFAAFFAAVNHASIAVLSVILALQPAVVMVVAWVFLREPATRAQIGWTVVGICGVVVVVLGGDPKVTGDSLGILLGSVALLAFVGYYVAGRHVRTVTAVTPLQWMTGVTTVAALAMLPVVAFTAKPGDFARFGSADLAYLLFMAALVGGVGHTMLGYAHRFVPAGRSSIIMLGMNVVSIGLAWVINHQPVTWLQVAGGVIVLGSVAATVRSARRPVIELAMEPA